MIEFTKGNKYPTSTDLTRIADETKYEGMLRSTYTYNHSIVTKKGTASKVSIDPMIPIASLVSDIFSDLLFGEFPSITSDIEEAQKQLDDYNEKYIQLQLDMIEASTYCSALGTVVLYMYVDQNGEVKHTFIPANKCTWRTINNELQSIAIFNVVNKTDVKTTYNVQYHTIETGVHTVYELIVKTDIYNEIKSVETLSELETGLPMLPLRLIYNTKLLGDNHGKSDYEGKVQLYAEIDNRIDQINNVLDEQQDPWIVLPPGILDHKGRFNRAQGKMIERAETNQGGANTIEIVAWNPQLDAAFKQIETMLQLVFFTSRISKPIAGLNDNGGQVDSGRALKWKSINTFSAIKRKQLYWENAIVWYYRTASLLGDKELSKVKQDTKINVNWHSNIHIDQTEITKDILSQVKSNVLSRQTAMREIHGYNDKEAKQEIAQIKDESNSNEAIVK